MLKIARVDVIVQNVNACTACTTVIQKNRCRKCRTRGLAAGSATWCSFCLVEEESVAKEKALADWDATRCSNSSLKRDLAKRIIIPNKECYGCQKELADGDMQYYCSRCNFMFYKIYYYYYYYCLFNLPSLLG